MSSSVGVMPIDSFGFLDTGFSILKNKLPIRDFWIFTGLIVDYMGAFFLNVFGDRPQLGGIFFENSFHT